MSYNINDMGIFSIFQGGKKQTRLADNRNVYVGNISLDTVPSDELELFRGRLLKRALHRRIDTFKPDNRRVITRFLEICDEKHLDSVIDRALALDDSAVFETLKGLMKEFSNRHMNIEQILLENFGRVESRAQERCKGLPRERKLLIGALFTMEYSHESTSLFNPSVVIYPKQNDLAKGQVRVVFSFRATGEGHVSSIVFKSAVIDQSGDVYLEPVSRFALAPQAQKVSSTDYEIVFPEDQMISERVIFPSVTEELGGIEDARFVRFTQDDGSFTYFATYTAYDGKNIMPRLLETKDFHRFRMSALLGPFARDKGMALFPRKIKGRYAMISRIDDENLYLMSSDDVRSWSEAVKIQEPKEAWEFIKIGNCGSPIETKEGWVLLTHGVGPMRKYCIGAELLDLEDPSVIRAKLKEPLLSPSEERREGYVPNVVYSCGSILLNEKLLIPYASADSVSSIAVISLDELLEKLLGSR